MKKIIIFFILISQIVFAQQKQMSLEDAVLGRYTYLRSSTLKAVSWKSNDVFTFVEDKTLWAESVKNGDKEPVLTVDELKKITELELAAFPTYLWLNESEILIQKGLEYFVLNIDIKNIKFKISLPENAENAVFNEVGKFVSFTKNDDLFVAFINEKINQITNDGGNGIVNGQSVHRNEFGITNGIYNSPKGNYIAFYRKDESMVKDYPLVDFMAREAEHTPVKYPMAGMSSHHVKLGVFNIKTGETIFLNTGEPLDHYLTNVAWSPNEKSIYLAELNRKQNHMQLNCYNAISGEKIKTLFEEKSDKYVEPLSPVQFSEVNENEFYYLSRKDRWFHIYKYNTDGVLIQQITKGKWEVTRILGFDEKEKNVFVEGTLESPLENHIYKVEINTGITEKLTPNAGIHRGLLCPDADFIIDNWSVTDVPQKT
ncbi:MAG: S9 family peptidase, partial [Draconibacterium sp.]|nr:S9 family peptidase [Draconibacterium sp.]